MFERFKDTGLKVAHSEGVQKFENIISEISSQENVQVTKKEPGNRGLLMFRGNPTRTYYGEGKIEAEPKILWRYPEKPMCGDSTVGHVTREWCGNGWTGQPVVWEKEDGSGEIIFGAFDKSIHFVDRDTGKDARSPFKTGDIIKGSPTLDPDNFPLLYFGSRDNKLRIGALDRGNMVELWSLDANEVKGIWNDDWDGNPVVIDDILYEGGENGWFFIVKLNRHFDENGHVAVSPKILFQMPSYDKDFLAKVGDNDMSIENSVALYKDRVYFANSGGRVMGLDISKASEGIAPVVFDFWTGDDTDASIVIDEEGKLYVASEEERFNARSKEVGQIMKLDPENKENPIVWSLHVPRLENQSGGVWATLALWNNYIFVPTNKGDFMQINKDTGEIVWQTEIGFHAWSSPIVSENTLYVASCDGQVRGYSLGEKENPSLMWKFQVPSKSCIESTPALWNNTLYFGSRDGYLYALK